MKYSSDFYKLFIFHIILIKGNSKSQITSGSHIRLQHENQIRKISPQYDTFRKLSKETTNILCPPDYKTCLEHTTLITSCPNSTRKCIPVETQQTENSRNHDHLLKCPFNDQQRYFYPYDARKYIQCSNGQLMVLDCVALELFSISQRRCLPETHVLSNDHVHITTSNVKIHSINAAVQDDKIYCPMDLFGLYPHPFSNEKYLKCVDGHLYSKSCRPGFVFNFSSKFCERKVPHLFKTLPPIQHRYKDESLIETRSNDSLTFLKCPRDLLGTFVHPFHCESYINCSPAGTSIGSCCNGEIFSFRKEKCEAESKLDEYDHVKCKQNVQNIDPQESFAPSLGVFCSPKGSMNYPHPQTWHKYVHCNNGKVQVKRCPRNEIFSLDARKCLDESIAMATEINGL